MLQKVIVFFLSERHIAHLDNEKVLLASAGSLVWKEIGSWSKWVLSSSGIEKEVPELDHTGVSNLW